MAGDQLVPHRFQRVAKADEWFADRDIKANKLLQDRDGGLWIGTDGRGLIHVKDGQADVFTRPQGLSGNIACSLFEGREGNVWFGSERGVDRFRKLAVITFSMQQGLPDDVVKSVFSTRDGSIWVATNDGLARWNDGKLFVYKGRDGLPRSQVHSLYEDADGRLWASTLAGLAYVRERPLRRGQRGPQHRDLLHDGRCGRQSLAGGQQGPGGLSRGTFVDNLPWATFGRRQQA